MRYAYALESNPNGTNDLIMVEDGEIIDSLSEALFGYRMTWNVNKYLELSVCHEDFISSYEAAEDDQSDEYSTQLCKEISLETALRFAACSPCMTEEESEARIKAFFSEGGAV